MNLANLSAKEVLRMCCPETDLEKKLFELVVDMQDEIISLEGAPTQECDCDECEDFEAELDEIRDSISLIESGKVDKGLKKLKAIV